MWTGGYLDDFGYFALGGRGRITAGRDGGYRLDAFEIVGPRTSDQRSTGAKNSEGDDGKETEVFHGSEF
jgi:hypothetical protein